eukprot:scaffold26193_cov153-Skeletonema_marinoi.AAC.8
MSSDTIIYLNGRSPSTHKCTMTTHSKPIRHNNHVHKVTLSNCLTGRRETVLALSISTGITHKTLTASQAILYIMRRETQPQYLEGYSSRSSESGSVSRCGALCIYLYSFKLIA